MFTLTHYKILLRLAALRAYLDSIVQSSLEWDAKYREVFREGGVAGLHSLIAPLEQLDISLEWYDPDMDYDDDVLAYVRAVDEVYNRLTQAWKSLEPDRVRELLADVHVAAA